MLANNLVSLMESILCEVSIRCDSCGEKIKNGCDVSMALEEAEGFFEEGWRAINNYVYCPKCAKKKFKKIKLTK